MRQITKVLQQEMRQWRLWQRDAKHISSDMISPGVSIEWHTTLKLAKIFTALKSQRLKKSQTLILKRKLSSMLPLVLNGCIYTLQTWTIYSWFFLGRPWWSYGYTTYSWAPSHMRFQALSSAWRFLQYAQAQFKHPHECLDWVRFQEVPFLDTKCLRLSKHTIRLFRYGVLPEFKLQRFPLKSHSFEFKEPENLSSDLTYKGLVYKRWRALCQILMTLSCTVLITIFFRSLSTNSIQEMSQKNHFNSILRVGWLPQKVYYPSNS